MPHYKYADAQEAIDKNPEWPESEKREARKIADKINERIAEKRREDVESVAREIYIGLMSTEGVTGCPEANAEYAFDCAEAFIQESETKY